MLHRTFVLALVSAIVGCSYDGDHHHDWANGPPTYTGDIAQATIDVDATLTDIQPGQEAGAFIEYRAGGTWRVFTSCDSALVDANGQPLPPCVWDILVIPFRTPLRSVSMEGLEFEDIAEVDDAAAHLIAVTDADFDGMLVEAEPGEPVRVDVYLDNGPAERYVYWVEAGGLNSGAPTNPIDLSPNGT
jgi:hypothetical protein